MLPLATDEDVNGDVIRGLLRRLPDADLVRVQDAGITGMEGFEDPDVLEWAASEGRVLITDDSNTMIAHAWARVNQGKPMPGLLVLTAGLPIGQAIHELVLIAACGQPDDFANPVRYLPLS